MTSHINALKTLSTNLPAMKMNYRPLIWILLIFILSFECLAQKNPYSLSPVGDFVGFNSFVSFSVLLPYADKGTGLSPLEIELLDKKNIFFLDKLTGSKGVLPYDDDAFYIGGLVSVFSTLLPALTPVLGGKSGRHDMGTSYFIIFEGLLANIALGQISNLFKKPAPLLYHPEEPMSLKTELSYSYSFFSIPTSIAATNAFLSAKMINDFYPDNKYKSLIWSTAFAIPAVTGFFQIKSGESFLTDVLVGFAVGAVIGWGIPELHRTVRGN